MIAFSPCAYIYIYIYHNNGKKKVPSERKDKGAVLVAGKA